MLTAVASPFSIMHLTPEAAAAIRVKRADRAEDVLSARVLGWKQKRAAA